MRLMMNMIATAALLMLLSSCATMQQAMNFSDVKFKLDKVSSAEVLGIDLLHTDSTQSLGMFDFARLMQAFSQQQLPLTLVVDITTENPYVNHVDVTLIRMDWTLVLQGKDTIHGSLREHVQIPAGEVKVIPLSFSVDLFEFFKDENSKNMLSILQSFMHGGQGLPEGLALKVKPIVDTPVGLIKYDEIYIDLNKADKKGYI